VILLAVGACCLFIPCRVAGFLQVSNHFFAKSCGMAVKISCDSSPRILLNHVMGVLSS